MHGRCLARAKSNHQILEKTVGKMRYHNARKISREKVEAIPGQIVAQELRRLGLVESDLETRFKSDTGRLRMAACLLTVSMIYIKTIVRRVQVIPSKTSHIGLHEWMTKSSA